MLVGLSAIALTILPLTSLLDVTTVVTLRV